MKWLVDRFIRFVDEADTALKWIFFSTLILWFCLVIATIYFLGGLEGTAATTRPSLGNPQFWREISTVVRTFFEIVMISTLTTAAGAYFNPGRESKNAVHFRRELSFGDMIAFAQRGDTVKIFVTWQVSFGRTGDLEKALARGVNIDLLMLKANSESVRLRAVEINKPKIDGGGQIRAIRDNLEALYDDVQANGDRHAGELKVNFYNGLCPCPIYLIVRPDDAKTVRAVRGWTGFYLKKSDEESVFLEWIRGKNIEEDHFLDEIHDYYLHKRKLSDEKILIDQSPATVTPV